ncbi:MAG: hypothetical protein AAGB02_02420 [Pseudomonadota bacterium]
MLESINFTVGAMMDQITAFQNDLANAPAWVQAWVNFMGVVIALAIPFSLTRSEARWTILSMIFVFPLMIWMHSRFGYQRILGLPHILFWTPLAIYLWRRRDVWRVRGTLGGKWILVLFVTFCASLVMDYADVIRYALGERI